MRNQSRDSRPGPRGPRTRTRTFADYRDDAFARRVVGVLSLSRGGTGFVAPDGGGEDVLVPEERVGAALPGDRVELALVPPERGSSRVTGRVVRVDGFRQARGAQKQQGGEQCAEKPAFQQMGRFHTR